MKLYRCAICGQIISIVEETGVPVICCGEPMEEIVPGTTDADVEKHIPVYETKDNHVSVAVGSVPHPMTGAHYIEWVALKTKKGFQIKFLHPGDEPRSCFELCHGDYVEGVYAYCNIHSLWENSVH